MYSPTMPGVFGADSSLSCRSASSAPGFTFIRATVPYITPSSARRSDRRLDVLVHPEEVAGVVPGLQFDQPVVVRPVRGAQHRLLFLAEAGEVQVEPALRVRLKGGERIARPLNVGIGRPRVGPSRFG